MSNGRQTGMISGAAQGAVVGGAYGGWVGAGVGAVVGGVIGAYSGADADRQHQNQNDWARYNASLQYGTALYNLQSQLGIAAYNIRAAQMQANFQNQQTHQLINYNVNMRMAALEYESKLYDAEIEKTWNAFDLDVTQIHQARARELGSIVADQAASGTVIGEGSNADIVIDQQTQEAMDVSIAKFNADQTVAEIANAKAKSAWEANIAISNMLYEGMIGEASNTINANLQTGGQAITALLSTRADRYSAMQNAYMQGIAIQMGDRTYNARNTANMTQSLFSSAGQGASLYYRNKPVDSSRSDRAGESLLNG